MKSEEFENTTAAAGDEKRTSETAQNRRDGTDGMGAQGADADVRQMETPGNDELEALRDRYMRLAAEYENFRRRTEKERGESRDRAQGQLVERLLEPLDDLQRVAQFSKDGTTVDTLLEGVRMVDRKLMRALESAGLEALDARGERFDPAQHDALMVTATPNESEDDTVGDVLQPGYRFRGILLRPARVQVRKYEG